MKTSLRGIYDHEHEMFMECEALKEAANILENKSYSTHPPGRYNPVAEPNISTNNSGGRFCSFSSPEIQDDHQEGHQNDQKYKC